jgi:hypothetical protein
MCAAAGYVTSDCGAVSSIQRAPPGGHAFTNTSAATVAAALRAGVDIDCGAYVRDHLEEALAEGAVTRADVDRAVSRLLAVQLRLGLLDPPASPYDRIPPSAVHSEAHLQLAREAARQSLVLLKHTDGALPLARGLRVAVVGPNAADEQALMSDYFGVPGLPPAVETPLAAVRRFAGAVQVAEGCTLSGPRDEAALATAVAAAAGAEATLLFLGLNQTVESETNDRTSLALPGAQAELLARVAAAAAGPVVVVVLSGGPVDLSFAKASPAVQAILWAGYGGTYGGVAVAEALWGEASPSGRLTQTWYGTEYVRQVRMSDMGFRPNATSGSPGRGYRYFTGSPVFEFGDGLSFASFTHEWAPPPAARFDAGVAGARMEVAVRVSHAGGPAAAEALLLFLEPPRAPGRPLRVLRRFAKVGPLSGGEGAVADLAVTAEDFHLVRPTDGVAELVAGRWTLRAGTLSASVLV